MIRRIGIFAAIFAGPYAATAEHFVAGEESRPKGKDDRSATIESEEPFTVRVERGIALTVSDDSKFLAYMPDDTIIQVIELETQKRLASFDAEKVRWADFFARKVPMKGFRAASYIPSPFPKLRLAQCSRPRQETVA